MLTERDKKTLIHIEKYGAATISQIAKIFYRDCLYGHDMARKRLKYMNNSGFIK